MLEVCNEMFIDRASLKTQATLPTLPPQYIQTTINTEARPRPKLFEFYNFVLFLPIKRITKFGSALQCLKSESNLEDCHL